MFLYIFLPGGTPTFVVGNSLSLSAPGKVKCKLP